MRILREYFNGKDTVIGLGFIQNGCQVFTADEAERVFGDYDISKEIQDEALQILSEETEKEKDLDIIQEYVKSDDVEIRKFVAMVGIKEYLDILVNDVDWFVRYAVAKHRHRDLLNGA